MTSEKDLLYSVLVICCIILLLLIAIIIKIYGAPITETEEVTVYETITKTEQDVLLVDISQYRQINPPVCNVKLECPVHGGLMIPLNGELEGMWVEKKFYHMLNVEIVNLDGQEQIYFWSQGFYDYGSVVIKTSEGIEKHDIFFPPPLP